MDGQMAGLARLAVAALALEPSGVQLSDDGRRRRAGSWRTRVVPLELVDQTRAMDLHTEPDQAHCDSRPQPAGDGARGGAIILFRRGFTNGAFDRRTAEAGGLAAPEHFGQGVIAAGAAPSSRTMRTGRRSRLKGQSQSTVRQRMGW